MPEKNRISIVDTLRGWALLIVTISNITGFAYSDKGTVNGKGIFIDIFEALELYFFMAKGWTLLFVLFGFGFGMLLENTKGNVYWFFGKRMLVLLGFALANSLLYNGDILRDYAVIGLLCLFFYKLSSKKLLLVSGILLLLFPFFCAFVSTIDNAFVFTEVAKYSALKQSHHWFDVFQCNLLESYYYEVVNPFYLYTVHYLMLVCMLFGLALHKMNFFQHLASHQKKLKIIALVTLLFSILLHIIIAYSSEHKATYTRYFQPFYWTVVSTMLFTASSICLLYLNGKCKTLFGYFATYGKMTLTNYMMQSVVSFFVFGGIGLRLFNTMPFYFYFVFAIVLYALQVLLSRWWLKKYNYGPLEWLWRSLSGTKSKSFSIEKTTAL
jgi:uncharacterized protein